MTTSYDDNVAYIYTRKPKRGEKVIKTMAAGAGVYADYSENYELVGIEMLKVHEIWVNGRIVWPIKKAKRTK